MKISEFIEGRNVNYDTVRRYINRNPEMFKGHVGRANKIELDGVAVQLLEEKYPALEPVQVIQDTSARDELLQLHKKYAAAMEKLTALTEQNSQLMVIQLKQKSLEEENLNLSDELDERVRYAQFLENELEKQRTSYEFLKGQLKNVEFNLAVEKKKSWWDKLKGR